MTEISLDRLADALGFTSQHEADAHQYATVSSKEADGSLLVQMNGATGTARAADLCGAEVGDRVLCVISNGQAAAIGKVGGPIIPQPPELHTGTITKVYTGNGFQVEVPTFYELGGTVTIPIQFSATSNFAGNGTTTAASIPADYAPPRELRVPLFCTNLAWNAYSVGYAIINADGTIAIKSTSSAVWFGVATYIRG